MKLLFRDKKFIKQMIALSVPIALQNLITAILNIFDQVMVSWLDSSIADYCLSAVLLANQIVFIFQIIIFAVGNTVNIFLAQYTENGKKDLIPHRVGVVLIINTLISIVATAVCYFAPEMVVSMFNPKPEYAGYAAEFLKIVSLSFWPSAMSITLGYVLRAIKRLKVPLIAMCIAVATNIVLNYLFMFGGLGITGIGFAGAAWATVVSRIFEAGLIIAGLIIFKYPIIAAPKKMFYIDKEFNKQYFKMFFPIICNEIFWVLSTTVFLYVYDKLPDSQIALAGYNVCSCVDRILSVAIIGIGNASAIIIGNSIGEGDMEKVKNYSNYGIQFSIISGLIIGLITFGSAFVAPSFFTNISDEAKYVAKILLIIFAFTSVLRSMSFMLVIGVLRAGGDTTFCMMSETIIIWAFAVPLVMVGGLVFHWNIFVLYAMTMVAEALKCIVFYLRTRHYDKWIRLKA